MPIYKLDMRWKSPCWNIILSGAEKVKIDKDNIEITKVKHIYYCKYDDVPQEIVNIIGCSWSGLSIDDRKINISYLNGRLIVRIDDISTLTLDNNDVNDVNNIYPADMYTEQMITLTAPLLSFEDCIIEDVEYTSEVMHLDLNERNSKE